MCQWRKKIWQLFEFLCFFYLIFFLQNFSKNQQGSSFYRYDCASLTGTRYETIKLFKQLKTQVMQDNNTDYIYIFYIIYCFEKTSRSVWYYQIIRQTQWHWTILVLLYSQTKVKRNKSCSSSLLFILFSSTNYHLL